MSAYTCTGCGATVDPRRALPFRCPEAREGDGVDHVLAAGRRPEAFPAAAHDDPWIAFAGGLTPRRLAAVAGLDDEAWAALVEELQGGLERVDGRRFRWTPLAAAPPALAAALAPGVELWLKDESGQPSGSHKGRHLFGVMLYLRVLEAAGLPAAAAAAGRPLAIASCGNAALAAAVIAKASARPLDVYLPPDARRSVLERLDALDARVHVCHRAVERGATTTAGDPCYHAFRDAVADGALPFGVQGSDNGLAVEGGRTLGWEIAADLAREGVAADHVFVQVGGGALGSGVAQGLSDAHAAGLLLRLPRLHTVQTAGAAPLARAWRHFEATAGAAPSLADALSAAARRRDDFMWPWETPPRSVAHGILDDETYDWLALVRAMAETGGQALIASEEQLRCACDAVRGAVGIDASPTGTAGLAGLLAHGGVEPGERVVALITGAAR